MASPVDAARVATNISTAATSHAINVGSPAAGTLLLVYVRLAGAPGTVAFTGYTSLNPATIGDQGDASDDANFLFYRLADGSEGATDTLTSGSQKLAAICWGITGAADPATIPPGARGAVGTAANINPPLSPQIDTSAITAAGPLAVGYDANADKQAQSFVALGTSITNVTVKLQKVGSPTDNLIIEIQSDSAGQPSTTVIGTVATLSAAAQSTTATLVSNSCSIAVTEGTRYWIVLRRDGAASTTNYMQVLSGTSNLHVTGKPLRGTSGGVWTDDSLGTDDWAFSVTSGASSKDYLFITAIGLDSETATATAPAGYTNTTSANSGTAGAVATNCMIWGASKQATATSDDPAAWTSTAPNSGVTAYTIAISPPAAAGAPGPASSRRQRRANRYLTVR